MRQPAWHAYLETDEGRHTVGHWKKAFWGAEKFRASERRQQGTPSPSPEPEAAEQDELQQFFSLGSGVAPPATAQVDDGKPKVIALV